MQYKLNLISTSPTVVYKVLQKNGNFIEVDNPSALPDMSSIEEIHEPIICSSMLVPNEFIGNVITLCEQKRGRQIKISYVGNQALIEYYMPLNEIVLDFFDKLKKTQKKSIIIAPANFLAYPNDTMLYDSERIIEKIKNITNLKIIFRPHPINRIFFKDNFENIYVNTLLSKYSKDKRVIFDFSEDYSKCYSDSAVMITDLSATAFTYSFLTFNPVLFYSPKPDAKRPVPAPRLI